MNKPFAESCAENQQPILEVLQQLFVEQGRVLEIGSGTGQHAVFFTSNMPHLEWQPTDLEAMLPGIGMWMEEAGHNRIQPPLVLDVSDEQWALSDYDYVFTANTTHIVSWSLVQSMFRGIAESLKTGGLFAQYGPFNYDGQYTSESNARFDQWLKSRDVESGIRNFEDIVALADSYGMYPHADIAMPANNRILVWQKESRHV